jgi:hypothetical protein
MNGCITTAHPTGAHMDDDSLHSLLARGRLSGAQRDRILERVLDEHAPPRRAFRRWVVAASVALPAAAAMALVLALRGPAGDDAEVGAPVPKGAHAGAVFEARCSDRAPGQCRSGDRLIFSVDGADAGGSLAGYAECGAHERIWYFPTMDGAAPRIPARAGVQVVEQVVRIGKEHGTGPCKVHLFLLEAPGDRASLLSGKARVRASAVIPLTIGP